VSYHRIFVDGHSVIFAWPELRTIHQRAPQEAQNRLRDVLTQFQDAIQTPVTLVFDGGKRRKASGESAPAGVELRYSAPGETADAVIERCVAGREPGTKVLVVTEDRIERTAVEGSGAETMSAENLAGWIEREQKEFGRRLGAVRKQAGQYQKMR
jgi:predicted RNA-binding protein with PIN domain